MLDQPTELMPFERDKIKLDFALFVAKRARRFHAEAEQIIDVIAGKVSPDVARVFSPEGATETAQPVAPEGEAAAPVSPSPIRLPVTETTIALLSSEPNSAAPATDPANKTSALAKHAAKEPPVSGGSGEVQDETAIHLATPSRAGKSAGSQGSAAPSIKDRIVALHKENPELTAREAALRLGEKRTSVTSYSSQLNLKWGRTVERREGMGERVAEVHFKHREWPASRIAEELEVVAPYVRATAKRKGLILPPEAPRSGSGRREAASPAPAPERPPAPIRPPVAASPSVGSAVVARPMVRPKGTRLHLRDDAGLYLHYSCTVMTSDKAYAWSGTHAQLLACRQKFELASGLTEHVVGKEQSRAAA